VCGEIQGVGPKDPMPTLKDSSFFRTKPGACATLFTVHSTQLPTDFFVLMDSIFSQQNLRDEAPARPDTTLAPGHRTLVHPHGCTNPPFFVYAHEYRISRVGVTTDILFHAAVNLLARIRVLLPPKSEIRARTPFPAETGGVAAAPYIHSQIWPELYFKRNQTPVGFFRPTQFVFDPSQCTFQS
jgi:hypothetical protein